MAELLFLSTTTVRKRIADGDLEAVKLGRYTRVLRRSVWEYQARQGTERW